MNGERYFYAVEASIEPLYVSKLIPTSAPYRQNLEILSMLLHSNGIYDHSIRQGIEWAYYISGGKHINVEGNDEFVRFNDIKMLFLVPLIGGLQGLVTLIIEILCFRYSEKGKKNSVISIKNIKIEV